MTRHYTQGLNLFLLEAKFTFRYKRNFHGNVSFITYNQTIKEVPHYLKGKKRKELPYLLNK